MVRRIGLLITVLGVGAAVAISGCSAAVDESTEPPSQESAAPIESASESQAVEPVETDDGGPSIPEVDESLRHLVAETSPVIIDSIEDIRMAVDEEGRWWVSAIMVPDGSENTDNADVYAYQDGGQWTLVFLGTGALEVEIPVEVYDSIVIPK